MIMLTGSLPVGGGARKNLCCASASWMSQATFSTASPRNAPPTQEARRKIPLANAKTLIRYALTKQGSTDLVASHTGQPVRFHK